MTTAPTRPGVAQSIDDAKLSAFHFKAAATAGAGFFTDSYDLNVIGTVTLLATPQFHLNGGRISMLTSSTLLAVASARCCSVASVTCLGAGGSTDSKPC